MISLYFESVGPTGYIDHILNIACVTIFFAMSPESVSSNLTSLNKMWTVIITVAIAPRFDECEHAGIVF